MVLENWPDFLRIPYWLFLKLDKYINCLIYMVGGAGIEPATPAV
jgi:hypothetical protein